MTTPREVTEFFARYREALLARDEKAIATMYAVPGLILFPGNALAVSKEKQTEQFFASSWPQYEGVDDMTPSIDVLADAPATVWADVTWSHDGVPRERMCYQLVESEGGYRIAVLTPMDAATAGAAAD